MSLKALNSIDLDKQLTAFNAILKIEDDYFVFYLDDDEINTYEISSSACNTPEKLISWVFHLSEKRWMRTDLLNHFIRVASQHSNISLH
ncbi:MAG TPA: hypothetical protein ACHBX6_13190 [Arsenophonus nasoniae]|uniref:hypothetical protein n=1 Tax=Arsenophonus nasoniae TaxID=638 RepID=UPI0038793675